MNIEFKELPKVCQFYLYGTIDETMSSNIAKEIASKIQEINEIKDNNRRFFAAMGMTDGSNAEVNFHFHLNTYGGYVDSMFAIHDMLKELDLTDNGIHVTLVCEGKVMSAGIGILLSVRDRFSGAHTRFMIHQLENYGVGGKVEEVHESLDEMKRQQKQLDKIILDNTNITKDELNKWYSKRGETYFNAEQAVKRGLVQTILNVN